MKALGVLIVSVALIPVAARSAHNENGQGFDVRNYGAKCDGAADDSAAIMAAVSAAGAGQVYIPAATCVAQIKISTAGESLYIAKGGTLQNPAGSSGYAITVAANNVTIEGEGTVDGNKTKLKPVCDASNNCGGVRAVNVSYLTIRDLTFTNSHHNIFATCTPQMKVLNTKQYSGLGLSGVQVGILSGSAACGVIEGPVVDGNLFDTTGADAPTTQYTVQIWGYPMYAVPGPAYRINHSRLTNNTFYKRHGLDSTELRMGQNAVVSGNLSYGGTIGISMVEQASATVTGNTSHGPTLECLESCDDLDTTFSGNVCYGDNVTQSSVHYTSFYPPGTGPGRNLSVTGDTSTGLTRAAIWAQDTSGVYLSGINAQCALFSGTANACIFLSNVVNFSVTNSLLDGKSQGVTRGIYVAGASSDGVISNNTIQNSPAGNGVFIRAGDGQTLDRVTVTGNVFKNVRYPISFGQIGNGVIGAKVKASANVSDTPR